MGKTVVGCEAAGDGLGEECQHGLALVFDDGARLEVSPDVAWGQGLLDVEIREGAR